MSILTKTKKEIISVNPKYFESLGFRHLISIEPTYISMMKIMDGPIGCRVRL